MATYSFHRLIMGKVEIGNFYCLIGDNRILFLQKCLLNCSSHFIRLLSEWLNLIGCRGNINILIFEKNLFLKNHKYIKYMFMALVTSLVVLFIAVLLQTFWQNFYSNASWFSLLCPGYTWAIVRWAFIGPLVLLWFILETCFFLCPVHIKFLDTNY